MNTHRERLASLRALMKKKGFSALVIPYSDPHLGEYVPDHWRVIRWLTGFTGSAATVVVTPSFAGLWTDSRYFIQADRQLDDSGFSLVKLRVPHTPEYIDWLISNIEKGEKVGVDGRVFSSGLARRLEHGIRQRGAKLNISADLITPVWDDRPPLPATEAFELPVNYAGETRMEKIERVRQGMRESGAKMHLLTSLDDIMWMLNIRGNDVRYSPLLLSFSIVTMDQVILFTDETRVPASLKTAFDHDNIVLLPYDTVSEVLKNAEEGTRLLMSPATVSASVFSVIPGSVEIIEDISIPTRLKAVKNETEIGNLREAMIYDGIALTRFFIWLEKNIGRERITELSAAARLEELRMQNGECRGLSFATIAAYNGNAALPHYVPDETTDTVLGENGIFLLDSGGQYPGGTTDITRTIATGDPDDEMKRLFTLALKGTIALAMVRFPYGTRGYQIEVLARKALWDNGMNYGHGTGHGVGSYLNVHEGPQTIGTAATGDLRTIMEPGMLTSDEPAVYREGSFGFRSENLILCVDKEVTDYGRFLGFETVTLCYIDKKLIDIDLLDMKETEWLDEYHRTVFERLSPHLNAEETEWLKIKTSPLLKNN